MRQITDEQRADLLRDYLVSKGVRFSQTRLGWQAVNCFGISHSGGDRTPSASVNLRTGHYKCHGCDLKGDAISLVMSERGVDFKSALAILGLVGDSGQVEIKEVDRWI